MSIKDLINKINKTEEETSVDDFDICELLEKDFEIDTMAKELGRDNFVSSKDETLDGVFELPHFDNNSNKEDELNIEEGSFEIEEADFEVKTNRIIEFGVINYEKSSIQTIDKWNVENEYPGAFFLYNCHEDMTYRKLYLIKKEDNSVIWESSIKEVPECLQIENPKSRIIYMSSKVLFLDNIDINNGEYIVKIEDIEESLEFNIEDKRNIQEDIIVKYKENKTNYIINHMLKYSPLKIDIDEASEEYVDLDKSIIIEKTGNIYRVLLNKLDGILLKPMYLKNGTKKYFEFYGEVSEFIEIIKNKLNEIYDIEFNVFDNFNKLLIVDNRDNLGELTFDDSMEIITRSSLLKYLNNTNDCIIDTASDSITILFRNDKNQLVRIKTTELGMFNRENTLLEINTLSKYMNNSNILYTGFDIVNDDSETGVISILETITGIKA